MCTSCGCDHGKTGADGEPVSALSYAEEASPARAQHNDVPASTQKRRIQIEQSLLLKNDLYAQKNRELFARQNILALNILSSPGSGKTTLLTTTLNALKHKLNLAVIVGDQETENDAQRIRKTGVSAVQINTGKGCHLDALMVNHALQNLSFAEQALLFIENVGNLVCPAIFDLGEADKVVILSVTEGEDKPLKYPDMFHAADLLLLNKIDLLPYLAFDLQLCIQNAQKINPDIAIIPCSATTGEGMQAWYQWLEARRVQLLKERLLPLTDKIATIHKILPQGLLSEGE